MAGPSREPPTLALGPVLSMVAVLLASVLGLLLLDAAWAVPGASDAIAQQLRSVAILGPVLALIAPAVVVLAVGVPVLLLRWTEPASARPWSKPSGSSNASTADP